MAWTGLMKPTFFFPLLGHGTALLVFSASLSAAPVGVAEVLIGVRDNAAVKAKQALVQSAQADLGVRESMESTRVTIDALGHVVGEANDSQPEYMMRFERSLYDWGVNRNRVLSGTAYVEARDIEMSQAVLELSVGVSDAYHQLSGSFLRLGVHANERASLGELVDMMTRRVEQKVSPQVDLDIVRSRLGLVDVKVEQLHREIRRHQLSILRGTEILVETPDLGECSLGLELEESRLMTRVLELSPSIQVHEATLSALAAEVDALRSEHYPKIVGGYRVDTDANGDNFDQQGYLALRLEIQTGGNLESRIAAERARVLETRALREAETEAIVQQVGDLISEYATARRLVGIQKALAESRTEQKASYLRRFVAGRASWMDVLNADRDLYEAKSAQVSALATACGALSSMAILAGSDRPYSVTGP